METGLTRNSIIAELSRSPHGELKEYIPLGKRAAKEDPQFFAHLIAWDRVKGQIRDAKVALPVVSLMEPNLDAEFVENALAHLALLGPREMLRGVRFVLKECRLRGRMNLLFRTLSNALLERERNWPKWERQMLQHRSTLKELMSLIHVKPNDDRTSACLFRDKVVDGKRMSLPYPAGGLFETVAQLRDMPALEAAGTIMGKRIPFLIALGALGNRVNDPDLVLALIKAMTATELVTNAKMFEKFGTKTNPALRGAYQEAIEKAGSSTKNLLKTTTAVENVDDEDTKQALRGLQEKQIQKAGVEGNWLILADKSGSMSSAIAASREVAGTLAKLVKGQISLTFFDSHPMAVDVTGCALDVITKATRHIVADGQTSIGCGLLRAMEAGFDVDGIAIISDGGENTAPWFHHVYPEYVKKAGKSVPVYLFLYGTAYNPLLVNARSVGIDIQVFDMSGKDADRYSIPNLVATMRSNRYSLIDEILDTRLLKLPDALKNKPVAKAFAA